MDYKDVGEIHSTTMPISLIHITIFAPENKKNIYQNKNLQIKQE